MGTNNLKFVAALVLLIAVSVLVSGCEGATLGLAEDTPTPIPTVVEEGRVNAEGRIIPARSSNLGFLTSGEISEILVSEGQQVSRGDVLARLGQREPLEAVLSQAMFEQLAAQQALDDLMETSDLVYTELLLAVVNAEQALSDAQNALNELDTPEFQDELDDRNIAVQDAQEELEDAQTELDKYQDLDPDNPTRKNAQDQYDDAFRAHKDAVYERDTWQNRLDQGQATVDLAQAQQDDINRQLLAHQNGPDPDNLAIAQARLDNANAQVLSAQRALNNMDLIAPYDGTIIDINDLEPGEIITPAKVVITLADLSSWMVETHDLSELDVVDIEVGQKAVVIPDALPALEMDAVIVSINQGYTERSGEILYTVLLQLSDGDPKLRWGMTVTVTIE